MFLTLETLERYNACEKGKEWFTHFFPNGGELMDVIQHRFVHPETLHWGFANLITTQEEREAYYKKLAINVDNYFTVYECDHIEGGEYITRSSHIKNSNYIFSCKEVVDSNNVSSSDSVERSNQIFNSEFVYDSEKVYQSKNITQSLNVINSDYVVRSSSIMNATNINNSHYVHGLTIGRTKQVKDSMFITECVNVKKCLFCSEIKDREYMLFNKPVDPDEFELISNQLKNILAGWQAEFVKGEWPEGTIPLDSPQIQRNIMRQFAQLPEKFWRWVKTLPNYDSMVLYAVTFQANLITE